MKRCLITGGAGFIGSNLAKRLLNEEWNVTVVDDLSNGELTYLPDNIDKFIMSDYSSKKILNNIIKQKYDVVFHLAAKPRVGYSVEYPTETTNVNVMKMVSLLDACRGNVQRFVNTSSSSVYGRADILPTTEESVHNPKSPYALQKSVSEQYCKLFSELYNLDTVSVRPFNVFGPNQKGDSAYCTAISAWLYAAKHNKSIRSDGDGTQTRDMTYVDNVVDIFVRCGNYNGILGGESFNAGTGESVSNNEILDWFRRTYLNCEIVNAPWRVGDVMHTKASIKKVKEMLGYKPLVNLWDGIELTKQWAMKDKTF